MESDLRLVGANLALDLVNTLDSDAPGGDHLQSEEDVAQWLDLAGIEGRASLVEARRLRALLSEVLHPLAERREPASQALQELREAEVEALGRAVLELPELRWTNALDPIAHAGFELVRTGPLDRLRRCDNCAWLFLDLSRNQSRRWCSMDSCGTKVKARRLTERRRSSQASPRT